jgi:hypothetical protein
MQGLPVIVIAAMMTPATLISACGLLLLGIYNKHASSTASLRTLNRELRSLANGPVDKSSEWRRLQVEKQCRLLRRRLTLTLRQIQYVAVASCLFLLTSLMLAAGQVLNFKAADVAAILLAVGIFALIVPMALVVVEARTIDEVLDTETAMPNSLQASEPNMGPTAT